MGLHLKNTIGFECKCLQNRILPLIIFLFSYYTGKQAEVITASARFSRSPTLRAALSSQRNQEEKEDIIDLYFDHVLKSMKANPRKEEVGAMTPVFQKVA